jgi:general secretion pathway protein M
MPAWNELQAVVKLRSWYAGLQEREQRFVIIGAVGVAALVLVGGLLLPLQSAVSRAVERREARTSELAWMQANAPLLQSAGDSLPADTGEAPVVLVDRVGHESGIAAAFRGTQPSGTTGVRVQLEAAPFDTMIAWLATLEQRYGLAIESITIDRAAKPGAVNASVTFNQPKS